MVSSDQTEFKKVMVGLGEYYNKEITSSLIEIYWYDLKQISIQEFKQAASHHRKNPDNGQFFPKVADFEKILNGNSKHKEQRLDDTAQMQWLTILSEIRRIGSYGTLKLKDRQALAAVKSLGGWKFICSQTEAQLVWLNKEFVSTYKNFENTPVHALPDKLAGRIELENHKKNNQSSPEFQNLMNGIDKHRLNKKDES